MSDPKSRLSLMAVALTILAPLAAFAGRPFSTDDADAVDRGILEFESGTNLLPERQAVSYFSVKHGLTERMDIGFDFSYLYPGIEGLDMGAKFRLLARGDSKMALAYGFSIGESTFDLNLIFARDIPPLDFYLNVGAISSFEGISSGFLLQASLFEERLVGGVEIVSNYREDELSLEALLGVSYNILENSAIDTGLGIGLKDSEKWRATFGMTYGL